MAQKVGRNQPCPCGSGQKYKYCCISKELRTRTVAINQNCTECGTPLEVDLSNDFMNVFASVEIPLKNFCKDNNFYLFSGSVTVGDLIKFQDMLREGFLNKEHLIAAYKSKLTSESTIHYLEDASSLHPAFVSRHQILRDAAEAHFQGKFTLSVPVLFAQIEGLLRELGGLSLSDKFRSTVSTDIWDGRMLFNLADSAGYFNAFISRLFEGQQAESTFNRNPILHGMNVDYATEEWSLILLLIVLEVRMFLWFERNTKSRIHEAI